MFDKIVHTTEDGIEYWLARDLQKLLGYARWENFEEAIARAIKACETAQNEPFNHFREVTKMII